MRRLLLIAVVFFAVAGLFYSCKKYKDAAPVTDPRLTNPYCNDPEAVNYNWGFPGKPDNTVCFYPSDLYVGTYKFRDSIYTLSGLFISADSFELNISRIPGTQKNRINVAGFCGGGILLALTASASYTATIDTVIGDSLSMHQGQQFCHVYDTVTGNIDRDRVDSTLLRVSFQVVSDTATYTHTGRAIKK